MRRTHDVEPTIEVFHRIAEELGLLDESRDLRRPPNGNHRTRSYTYH